MVVFYFGFRIAFEWLAFIPLDFELVALKYEMSHVIFGFSYLLNLQFCTFYLRYDLDIVLEQFFRLF